MKVTLRPIRDVEVLVEGKSLGNFTVASEWQGLQHLVSPRGDTLIVDPERGMLDILADIRGEPIAATVVRASPGLLP